MSDETGTPRVTTLPPTTATNTTLPQTPRTNGPIVEELNFSTPSRRTPSGTYQYSMNFPAHTKVKRDLAKETAGLYLGPVPLKDFLAELLPVDSSEIPCPFKGNIFEGMKQKLKQPKKRGSEGLDTDSDSDLDSEPKGEAGLYAPFVTAAQDIMSSLSVIATPKSGSDVSKWKPDISFYPQGRMVAQGVADFKRMEMFAEFKYQKSLDPFSDKVQAPTQEDPYPFESAGKTSVINRGQVAAYVATMFGSQFRTRVFTFGIYGNVARLYCWDASAIVVSEAFDYIAHDYLAEFLWRFDRMSPEQRGHDASITPLPDESAKDLAPEAALEYLKGLDHYGSEDNIPTNDAWTRHEYFALIHIPSFDDASVQHPFLISCPPKLYHRSPLGRQSRTMYAYNLQDKKTVSIKQYWRPVVDGILDEGSLYKKMGKGGADVVNLPEFHLGNDVPEAFSRNQSFRSQALSLRTRTTHEYRLYRMALSHKVVPITEFTSTKGLAQVVLDALLCYKDAYDKCQILHRDINPGSIVKDEETGRGMLVDWHMYGNNDPLNQSPRMPERVVTWQFASVGLLETLDGSVPHTIADDLESFFWVLVWIAILYTPHNRLDKLSNHLEIFDSTFKLWSAGAYEDRIRGGDGKKRFLKHRTAFSEFFIFTRINGQALANVISRLQAPFCDRYLSEPPELTIIDRKAALDAYATFLGPILTRPEWMIGVLRDGIRDEKWPTANDGAVRNVVSNAPSPAVRARKSVKHRASEDVSTRRTSSRLAERRPTAATAKDEDDEEDDEDEGFDERDMKRDPDYVPGEGMSP